MSSDSSERNAGDQEPSSSERRVPAAKILIVDDDERNAFAVSTVLEDLGHELIVARSGPEALRHLLEEEVAVILLDLHMPGMDGYETAEMIRARRRTRHIPIVFLTAVFRDESHLFRAYSAGAVDVVFKPVDPFILRSKVSVLVDLHLKTVEIRHQAELRHRLQEENFRVRTEKLMAERALQRSRERQEAIQRFLPVVFTSRGTDHPFPPRFVSENVERLTGFPASRFIDEAGFGVSRVHPDDMERVARALAEAVETGVYSCEYRWLCANGAWRVFLDQGVLAPEDEGRPREIYATMLDVTERHSLEQQLGQAQKMEAVGQLTGGVAHDFNNLLTVVLGNLDLIARHTKGDARLERQLGAMRHAAERGQSLTRQLLAFSRRQHLSPETIDVNRLVRGFGALVQRAVGEMVSIEIRLHEEPLIAHVDPAQLETALLNLAVNARDAMPEGGQLVIETIRAEREDRIPARDPEASPGPWVAVAVRDSGFGMPPDVQERAFEPFFTTKEAGKGSGLGLSQVYGFVRQSGGFVLIDSAIDKGTEMRICLPVAEGPVANRPVSPESRALAGRSETVLVVEDDPAVLALEVEMLVDLGYRVLSAPEASSALDIIKADQSIDMVFTDVVMPGGRTGVQLAAEAVEIRPGLKILLTSGYTGEALARHRGGDVNLPLIAKPFRQSELAAKLRDVLESNSAIPA